MTGRYSVHWNDDALAALAELWAVSTLRSAFTEAQAEVDRRLATDPLRGGKDVSEGLYRIISPPLAVFYEIDPTAKQVRVTAAGETRGLGE